MRFSSAALTAMSVCVQISCASRATLLQSSVISAIPSDVFDNGAVRAFEALARSRVSSSKTAEQLNVHGPSNDHKGAVFVGLGENDMGLRITGYAFGPDSITSTFAEYGYYLSRAMDLGLTTVEVIATESKNGLFATSGYLGEVLPRAVPGMTREAMAERFGWADAVVWALLPMSEIDLYLSGDVEHIKGPKKICFLVHENDGADGQIPSAHHFFTYQVAHLVLSDP